MISSIIETTITTTIPTEFKEEISISSEIKENSFFSTEITNRIIQTNKNEEDSTFFSNNIDNDKITENIHWNRR